MFWKNPNQLVVGGSSIAGGAAGSDDSIVVNVSSCREQIADDGSEVFEFYLDSSLTVGANALYSIKQALGSESCTTTD